MVPLSQDRCGGTSLCSWGPEQSTAKSSLMVAQSCEPRTQPTHGLYHTLDGLGCELTPTMADYGVLDPQVLSYMYKYVECI